MRKKIICANFQRIIELFTGAVQEAAELAMALKRFHYKNI